MVLWEHAFERYLALASLVVIAVSFAILAGKRLTEPAALILETPPEKQVNEQLSLKVHVKGAVQKPAVYNLPFGSRVVDAVKLAQPRKDADLNALNLADFLEDGQEVIVPSKNLVTNSPSLPLPLSISFQHSPKAKSKAELPKLNINLNTATEAELMQLPGIGQSLARRIIEYRRKIGGFKSIEQLLEVKGIGDKKLERIRPYVRL